MAIGITVTSARVTTTSTIAAEKGADTRATSTSRCLEDRQRNRHTATPTTTKGSSAHQTWPMPFMTWRTRSGEFLGENQYQGLRPRR